MHYSITLYCEGEMKGIYYEFQHVNAWAQPHGIDYGLMLAPIFNERIWI